MKVIPTFEEIRPGDPGWNLCTRPSLTSYMLEGSRGRYWALIEVYKDGSAGTFTEDTLRCSDDTQSRKPADDLDHAIERVTAFFEASERVGRFAEEITLLGKRARRKRS